MLFCKFCFSQNIITNLTQKSNYFISQDSYNLTWISSTDGVNVYDGANIKVYKPGKFNLIGSNIQSHFYEDCNSDLWFSTANALHIYKRNKDDFTPFQFKDELGQLIQTDYKVIGYENQFVFLRFGSKFGIFDINTKHLTYSFDIKISSFLQFDINIYENTIILVCNKPNEIKLFKNENFCKEQFKIIEVIKTTNTTRSQLLNDNIFIYNDVNKIFKYDIEANAKFGLNIVEKEIFDFSIRKSNQDLIILNQNYVKCYDKDLQVKSVEKLKQKGQLTPLNVIDNVIWYGIDGVGLFYFHEQKRKFFDFKMKENGNGVNARGLFQDCKGRFWYTSRSDGIGQFSSDGELIKYYRNSIGNSPTDFILNLIELQDGTLLGAGGSNVVVYNEKEQKFKNLKLIGKFKNSFFGGIHLTSFNRILLEDWYNPNVLFEMVYTNKENLLKPVKVNNDKNYEFYNINTNASDSIFLGINSTHVGLAVLKDDSIRILKTFNTNSSLNDVIKIKDNYYLALSDGLYVINRGELVKVNPNIDLLNQYSYSLLNFNDEIYISTNNGIIRYNIKNEKTHKFSITDGLQELEYNNTGALKDNKGNLWFSGINGINKFDPREIKLLDHNVPINISSIKINGIEKKGIGNLNDIEQLNFNYFDNTLEFNFNGIDYSDPSSVKLKYKLNNYEKNWNELKDNNGFARYPNLPPGQYSLHILAANSDGIWNKEPKIIDINILPPFWMTWWFITLMALSAIGLIYYIIKSYYKRKLEKQNILLREQALIIQAQQAIEKERNRIASEMHDDLGSGLTRIKYLSDKALQLSGQNEQDEVQKIANYSDDLVKNMSEIIWAMNSRFDNVDNLIGYVRRYASEYLEQNDMELTFTTNELDLNPAISGEKRRNVFLVIKEILHNAVKYSGAKVMKIYVEVKEGIIITISEVGGKGFDVEEMKDKSNGIYNMQKRMEGIGKIVFNRNTDGMEIKLFLDTHATHV